MTDDDNYSALDAFDEYVPASEDGVEQEHSSPLYTVTNPARTVSVTVCLDGRVDHVELAANVTDMTERELADEITVIADLARQKARSQ
ncbi:hypothetical protein ACQKHK_12765, partial [Staphylococcus capitis]